MKSVWQIWLRARLSAASLMEDRRGIAATEFALIVPIMLVLFFGTVEFSSGIAVDRKVTLMARTLADLTSQSSVGRQQRFDQLLQRQQCNHDAVFGDADRKPRSRNCMSIHKRFRRGYNGARAPRLARTCSPVTIPTALAVGGTYLIFSEVSYLYVPAVGYVMAKAGITLHDVAYTRPRQSLCVFYPTTNPLPANCPTL